MKKSIIAATILIIIMLLLAFNIQHSKTQKANLSLIDRNIEKIKLINKDFNLYLINTLEYSNFDIIEEKVYKFEYNLEKILNNNILNLRFKEIIKELKNSSNAKIRIINKSKSYKAILNNSFRIIQKLKMKIDRFDKLYMEILTLDKNSEININEIKQTLLKQSYSNKYEEYFLIHVKTILKYQDKLRNLDKDVKQLNLSDKLNELHNKYEEYTNKSMKRAHLSIGILFTLLALLIIIYLVYAFKLIKSNSSLSRFKRTVENSDNIVVVTDKNQIIKYVNEEFTKTSGYTAQEVIGKKPNILKSGRQSEEFYKELNETINNGEKWSGEFINVDKHGELTYEKASITPMFDENGEIKEFIAIKLDITNETIKGQQLKEKEKLLAQQSKMAAMGEMLENIAHQWRQPLSTISTVSTGIITQKKYGISNEEDEIKNLNVINDHVQYLSETIDDFRDFFKSNKQKENFNLAKTYKRALNISSSKFKSRNIEVIENLNDIETYGLENEIIQVLMNILSNAKDALENKKEQKKLIFVNIFTKDNNAIIEIKDNAGGIPKAIINKVFEPYFTTKHKSQGTGIGLYMSYEIITKHMKGSLEVTNEKFEHENIKYKGAKFSIVIPIQESSK